MTTEELAEAPAYGVPASIEEAEERFREDRRRTREAWARVHELQRAQQELAPAIAEARHPAQVAELRRERALVLADLSGVPDEIVAFAERESTSLLGWAASALAWAEREV